MNEHEIDYSRVTLVEHPVVARDLTILRDRDTPSQLFRLALSRIGIILAYHSLKVLPISEIEVETPIRKAKGHSLAKNLVAVPIMRAGLGLVDAVTHFIPEAQIGHLGMYRDEKTHEPVDYYSNLPSGLDEAMVLIVDPMLATGGSACDSVSFLKERGAKDIHFMCLISAPEGICRLQREHPEIPIVTAAIDEYLNEQAFIVPGLGDAGDRYFGTE